MRENQSQIYMTTFDQATILIDCLRTIWGYGLAVTMTTNVTMLLIFFCTNTNTLVDVGWALTQLNVAILCFVFRQADYSGAYNYLPDASTVHVRNIIALGLYSLWGLRLGGFIFIARVLKGENDKRYEELAANMSSQNNTENAPQEEEASRPTPSSRQDPSRLRFFCFQFTFQAVLVVFPALPIYFVFGFERQELIVASWSFWVGLVLVLFGVINETICDVELEKYKEDFHKRQAATEERLTKGLLRTGWHKKSRHPNLFFEIIAQLGFAILGVDENNLVTLVSLFGPVILFCIMKYVTIPATETTMKRSRPNWLELIQDTNMFWPF